MWPFQELSLSAATVLSNVASVVLLGCLIAGVIATFIIVRATNVKEYRWAEQKRRSDERIASAISDAAKASLEVARFKAPRRISKEHREKLSKALKAFPDIPFDFAIVTEPEAISFMEQIASVLEEAGWKRKTWKGAPGDLVYSLPGRPATGIVTHVGLEIQFANSRTLEWGTAIKILWDGLLAAEIEATALRLSDNIVNPDAVHIKVGRKP
jgi:hypothetical protein